MTPWDKWRADPCATPFQSPAWVEAWGAHLCAGERLTIETDDGWLPMFVWVHEGCRRLVPIGAGQSDYCDAVGETARLFSALAEEVWDELWLPDLRPGGRLHGAALPDGWVAEDSPHEICPVLTVPEGRTWLESLSKSKRRKIVHDRNRAEALGGVETRLAATHEIDEALDALFALHAARWAREGEAGVLADPKVQAFHRAAAPALAEAGLLRLALVRHEGRIVAVLLGMCDGRRGYSYINGVDFSVPGQSFGTLAFACLIEAALAEGAREFHFLRGEEPYKYALGAEPTQTVRRVVRRG